MTATSGREFSCFPAAVLVIVVNSNDELLLFSRNPDEWVILAGAVEANETIRDAAYRELREEAGDDLSAQAVGVAHAHTFHYDEAVQGMISLYYVMRYECGDIRPGSDMSGADYRWWALRELKKSPRKLAIPRHQVWILERAVALARSFHDQEVALEYFVEGDG